MCGVMRQEILQASCRSNVLLAIQCTDSTAHLVHSSTDNERGSVATSVCRTVSLALIRTTSSRRASRSSSSSSATEKGLSSTGRNHPGTRWNPKAKVDVFDNDLLKLHDAEGVKTNRQRGYAAAAAAGLASTDNGVVIGKRSA